MSDALFGTVTENSVYFVLRAPCILLQDYFHGRNGNWT